MIYVYSLEYMQMFMIRMFLSYKYLCWKNISITNEIEQCSRCLIGYTDKQSKCVGIQFLCYIF